MRFRFCFVGIMVAGVLALGASPAMAAWTTTASVDPQLLATGPNDLSCTGSFCAAVGRDGAIATSTDDGTTWTLSSSGTDSWNAVSCASGPLCVAVNGEGEASTYNGSSWSAPAPADTVVSHGITKPAALTSVSCASASFCVATDPYGNALTSTDGGSTWTKQLTDAPSGTSVAVSISCPTSSFCMAVDSQGNAIQFNDGTWTSSSVDPNRDLDWVSCTTTGGTLCMALDTAGQALTYNGTVWSSPSTDGGTAPTGVASLSCPTASGCIVIGQGGQYWTYAGATWSETNGAFGAWGHLLGSISCTGSSACMAIDDSGIVFTYSGSSWTQSAIVGGGGIDAITCPSATECVAVDANGRYLTYNGTTWSQPQSTGDNEELTSVGCGLNEESTSNPPTCFASDASGDVISFNGTSWTTPAPAGGATPDTAPVTQISCGSYVCAFLDSQEGAVLYTATGTGLQWSQRQELNQVAGFDWSAHPPLDLSGVSCAGFDCYVIDRNGAVFDGAGDQDGSASWDYGGSFSSTSGGFDYDGPIGGGLNAISCGGNNGPSPCVVLEADGDWTTFSGGSNTWSTPAPIATGFSYPTSISCTGSSSVFCQAVAYGQTATFNGSSWGTPTAAVSGYHSLGQISCPTSALCVSYDELGDGLVWTDTPAAVRPASSAVPPTTTAAPAAVAETGQVHVSGDYAAVRLRCVGSAGTSCAVTVALTDGKRNLGTAQLKLRAGRSRTVRIRLTRAGQRLVLRRHRLKVRLVVRESGKQVSGRTVTFASRRPKRVG
ncbi:MAG TPA: hypothetical protein VME22_09710 [Solirubrobacteraceae bacterium]|nr:hypothetical protein [Solirubrobacteraceae bacterium]